MLLFANKARSTLTGSVTSAAGQVAAVTTGGGSLFVGVGGVATSTTNPMRCVLTAVDANGNDTGAFEVVEVVRSGDNLTLQSRGLEGTSAVAWAAGTIIECRGTAESAAKASRIILAGGPIAAIVNTIVTSGYTVTVPANTLRSVGDTVRIRAAWEHTGALTSAPRFGCSFGGTAVVRLLAGATTDANPYVVADLTVSASAEQRGMGYWLRDNGSQVGFAPVVATASITADITVSFDYRMDAATETIQLMAYAIEIVRA